MEHGTVRSYAAGCRCDECRRAYTEYRNRCDHDGLPEGWSGSGWWTTLELERLCDLYAITPTRDLVKIFGRPAGCIRAMAHKLHLRKGGNIRAYRKWSRVDDALLWELSRHMPPAEAAKRIGRSARAARARLRALSLREDKMSINRVNISGNLTRDPEVRMTSGGTQVLSFGVAVNDRRRNPQTGEWEDYPNFVDCTMFGSRAEAVSRYLAKGSKVAIEGKLRYSSWERDGQRRSKLEVIVDEIEFMSRGQQGQGVPRTAAQPTLPVQTAPEVDVYDEDIPF